MKNPRESGDFFIEASTQKRWYKTIYLKFFAFFVIPVFAVTKKSVHHLPIAKVSFAFLQYLSLQLLKNLYIIFNN